MIMISKPIINLLRKVYCLNWEGIHGASHWSRVRVNGMMIAEDNGANQKVVELFAFFHDSMREDVGQDPMHGYRAAELVDSLTLDFLRINQQEKSLLMTACRHHTDRQSETDDITVLTCWDSDALDLGRIGVMPLAERLHTNLAKQDGFIQWCYQQSSRNIEVDL